MSGLRFLKLAFHLIYGFSHRDLFWANTRALEFILASPDSIGVIKLLEPFCSFFITGIENPTESLNKGGWSDEIGVFIGNGALCATTGAKDATDGLVKLLSIFLRLIALFLRWV